MAQVHADADSMTSGKKKPSRTPSTNKTQEFLLCMMDYILRRLLTVRAPVKIGLYVLIISAASVLGDIARPNPSYFSNKSNIFNQYFVKLGWGWTLVNIGAFLILTNLITNRGELRNLGRPAFRITIMTVYWYICTHTMELLENYTGSCSYKSLSSKRLCLREGYNWLGFDISGHCFLLVHSLLFINEESQVIHRVTKQLDQLERNSTTNNDTKNARTQQVPPASIYRLLLRVITPVLVLFMLLWEFMLLITALYFHTTVQKLLGMFIGLGGWFLVYKVLYLNKIN